MFENIHLIEQKKLFRNIGEYNSLSEELKKHSPTTYKSLFRVVTNVTSDGAESVESEDPLSATTRYAQRRTEKVVRGGGLEGGGRICRENSFFWLNP